MKKYGAPRSIVTDGLRAYPSAMSRDQCFSRAARGRPLAQQSGGEFALAVGEGLSLLEKGWDAPCLDRNRKAGFRLAPLARRGASPWRDYPRRSVRARELRPLMNGDLGTAAGRGDLVRLALRLIVEEALEDEVADVLGRERYRRGDGERPATTMAIGRAR